MLNLRAKHWHKDTVKGQRSKVSACKKPTHSLLTTPVKAWGSGPVGLDCSAFCWHTFLCLSNFWGWTSLSGLLRRWRRACLVNTTFVLVLVAASLQSDLSLVSFAAEMCTLYDWVSPGKMIAMCNVSINGAIYLISHYKIFFTKNDL